LERTFHVAEERKTAMLASEALIVRENATNRLFVVVFLNAVQSAASSS
jgi:hypothetical protein